MPTPMYTAQDDFRFRNWHLTDSVGGRVERFYTAQNHWTTGTSPKGQPYAAAIAGLAAIVRRAQRDDKRVRAVGGAWSLNNIMYTSDYMINTQHLALKRLGLTASSVVPGFSGKASDLVFAQCGVQIKSLNLMLEAAGLQMPTTGASNGQTIAGAIATGTHGSDLVVGCMSDFVLGLHVIGDDGQSWWLERASKPVVSDAFCAWLGATPRRDDALFRAAMVGFGSFGIVHGVLFQAQPLRSLRRELVWFDLDQVRTCLTSCVPPAPLPPGQHHLSIIIDPYRTAAGDKGAFVQAIYQGGVLAGPPALDTQAKQRWVTSPEVVSLAATLSDAFPPAIPGILKGQLRSTYQETPPGGATGSHGQVFGDVLPTNGGTSLEFGVNLPDTNRALDLVLAIAKDYKFGAFAAIRFVKGSDAFLAFTRFQTTATIELPGIDSRRTQEAYTKVITALKAAGIDHTFHWGQRLPEDPHRLRSSFPQLSVDAWLAARRAFLPTPKARRTFSNDLVSALGLAD